MVLGHAGLQHSFRDSGATAKVLFLSERSPGKIHSMDEIPDPNHTDAIASAYLRQLRRRPSQKAQAPGVQIWLELEQRIMQGPEPKEQELPMPVRTAPATLRKPKKSQSIWKRPISELWR